MALRLLLVRHGLSSFNLEKRIQGRNDLSTLSSEGIKQANLTGKALADISIDFVYSSPLQRAAETTKHIQLARENKLGTNFDQLLLEVDLPSWSGLTTQEVQERFPEDFMKWKKDPGEVLLKRENGESFQPIKELMDQAKNFLSNLIQKHNSDSKKTILIVAHNAILKCLILNLLSKESEGFRKLRLDNTSISIFNIQGNLKNNYQTQIECLNSTAHLIEPLPKNQRFARVILVRHGETDWNLQGRFQGQIDIPLNENGKSQAFSVQKFLKSVKLDKAFSSSMQRPIQTAKIILECHPKVKLINESNLIEIGHGLWEGKLESDINKQWPDLLKDWQTKPETVQMPEGETIKNVWERATASWEKICSSLSLNETALVVAHDAVNKTILCNLLGLSPSNIWMVKQGNGGISIIDISSDSNEPDLISCLNLTSHLGGIIDKTASGAL